MKYFAKIEINNTVTQVLCVEDDTLLDAENNTHEALGISHLGEVTGWSIWKETWKDESQRKNFAGIGYTYDPTRDAFIAPQPFPSWTLNEDTCQWDSPVPYPTDDKRYTWDEATTNWIEVTGE